MEFVYAVQRADLFDLAYPHGYLGANEHGDEVRTLVLRARERGFFVERRFAEQNNQWKQIIPYAVVVRGSEVLLLQRSKKGGDARLHDKLSIGVGGHINPPDAEDGDLLANAARREIEEEIAISGTFHAEPVGVINDDSNPVGAVHLGVVHRVVLERGDVVVRETDVLTASFVALERIEALARDPAVNLESWSRLIALDLKELLAERR